MYAIYSLLGLHVSASNMTVIRAIRAKIKKGPYPMTRAYRHGLYRAILQEHADARTLYRDVMGAMP